MINDNDMSALIPVKQFLASTLSGRKQAQPKKNNQNERKTSA